MLYGIRKVELEPKIVHLNFHNHRMADKEPEYEVGKFTLNAIKWHFDIHTAIQNP